MSAPDVCPGRIFLRLIGGNFSSQGTLHGIDQPSNVVFEASRASTNVDILDASHRVKHRQVVAVDAQEHGLDKVDRQLVQAGKRFRDGLAVVRQGQVETNLDVEAVDHGHQRLGLSHRRIPVAQTRERREQGWVCDEHV